MLFKGVDVDVWWLDCMHMLTRVCDPPMIYDDGMNSFEGGHKSVEIASGAEIILTTDPAFKDKGTAEKVCM